MISLPAQFEAYLKGVQAAADERNESDEEGGPAPNLGFK